MKTSFICTSLLALVLCGCGDRRDHDATATAHRTLTKEEQANRDAICDTLKVKNPKAADGFGCNGT